MTQSKQGIGKTMEKMLKKVGIIAAVLIISMASLMTGPAHAETCYDGKWVFRDCTEPSFLEGTLYAPLPEVECILHYRDQYLPQGVVSNTYFALGNKVTFEDTVTNETTEFSGAMKYANDIAKELNVPCPTDKAEDHKISVKVLSTTKK